MVRVLTRVFGIAENPKDKATNVRLWQLAEALVGTAHRKSRGNGHANYNGQGGGNAERDTSSRRCSALNQSLMELGALICTPRQPQCDLCPAKRLCVAHRTDRVLELPNLGSAAIGDQASGSLHSRWNTTGSCWSAKGRRATVNAHLWEFPNWELELDVELDHG